MRILIAHNAYQQRGGEDVAVEVEHDLLAERGHAVDLVLVSNDAIAGPVARLGAAFHVGYSTASRDLMARRIAAFRPDVVQVHNFFPLLTPSIYDACQDAGVPVVQTLHNFRVTCAAATFLREGRICELCITGSPYQAVRHRCYRGSALASLPLARMIDRHRRAGTWTSKVDAYFAMTEFARGKLIAAGLPGERIRVKPNTAPASTMARDSQPRHGALYVGRLSPEKGVEGLIEAWAGIDYPLRVAGDGPLGAMLRSRSPTSVTWLGAIPALAVREEMSRAAFLIMPSTCYEGFPLAIVEAYAEGLPVLASGIGSLAEIVVDGETGRHFSPGKPQAIADAVRDAVRAPDGLAAMSAKAFSAYECRYSTEAVYATLMETYRRLTARVPAGALSHLRTG